MSPNALIRESVVMKCILGLTPLDRSRQATKHRHKCLTGEKKNWSMWLATYQLYCNFNSCDTESVTVVVTHLDTSPCFLLGRRPTAERPRPGLCCQTVQGSVYSAPQRNAGNCLHCLLQLLLFLVWLSVSGCTRTQHTYKHIDTLNSKCRRCYGPCLS